MAQYQFIDLFRIIIIKSVYFPDGEFELTAVVTFSILKAGVVYASTSTF